MYSTMKLESVCIIQQTTTTESGLNLQLHDQLNEIRSVLRLYRSLRVDDIVNDSLLLHLVFQTAFTEQYYRNHNEG